MVKARDLDFRLGPGERPWEGWRERRATDERQDRREGEEADPEDDGRAPAVPVDHGAADHGPERDPDRDRGAEPRERLGDRARRRNPPDLAVERSDDGRNWQSRPEHQ